jgi:uncharacterized SAM-binding protein YcdF (DUF218 family)
VSILLKHLLLPPVSLLLILLGGLVFSRRRWGVGWWTALVCCLALLFLAMPFGCATVARLVETYPPLSDAALMPGQAQAIVILGSDSDYAAEFGGETVGELTLARLRYGAWLHRRTGLPILLSGGPAEPAAPSLAEHMDKILAEEYAITGSRLESRSRDTWENAVESGAILRTMGVERFYLVTHARDMARALRSFRKNGFAPIPAPMAFDDLDPSGVRAWIPSAKVLLATYYVLYEIAGGLAYGLMH